MKTKIIRKTASSSALPLRNNRTSSPKTNNWHKQKLQIIEKLTLFLKNKYNKVFLDKAYSHKSLNTDLNSIITENDIKSLDYTTILIRIEKSILEIVSRLETKEVSGLLDLNKINSMISDFKDKNRQEKVDVKKPKEKDIPNTNEMNNEKFNLHRDKSKDEWALIAKHNYEKHLEIEKEKKLKIEKSKMIQRQILENQIKEKEILKKKEEEENNKFHQLQVENIKKFDQKEIDKIKMQREKVKLEKEMQANMINQHQKLKEESKVKKLTEEVKYIEKIKNEMNVEDEKTTKKRINEKEVYRKIIQENDNKVYQKKIEKEKEKIEDVKYIEEYSKVIEKQNEDRKINFSNQISKMNSSNKIINYDIDVKKKEDLIKNYEEKKFHREREEKDKMYIINIFKFIGSNLLK
jgi:hypothetical protein